MLGFEAENANKCFFPYPDHLYSDSNEKKPGQRATLKATSS